MNKSSPLLNTLMLAALIGATESLMTALGTGLMFIGVVGAFGVSMRVVRPHLIPASHLVAGVLLASTLGACAELVASGWSPQWQQNSAMYAGLIALQCVVLDHRGFFQSAWLDRLRLCALFGLLMVGLGLLREWLGASGLHLASLTPGGFILLGLLLAGWQAWAHRTPSH